MVALNPLTLNIMTGIIGRPFSATVSGIEAGQIVEVRNDATPGFSYVNGRVFHSGLPYAVNTLSLRITEPGVGVRDARIDIPADGVALGEQGLPAATSRYLSSVGVVRPEKRVILVGDSFMFRNTFNGATGTVWDAIGLIGNRYLCHGEASWLRFRGRQSFDFDGTCNYGVFGETNTQISARLPAILAADPAKTVVRPVSLNSSSDAAYYQESMDAIAVDYAAVKAAGRFFVLPLPAVSGDSANTGQAMSPSKVKSRARLRRDLMAIYAYGSLTGVEVVDMDPGYADELSTLGYALPGVTSEGIHPSTNGAFLRSRRYDPVFSKLFNPRNFMPGSNSNIYDAALNPQGAVNLNPGLAGTGGTAGTGGSGSVADSFQGGNGGDTGHTRTYSKVAAMPNTGRPGQRCVLAGTMTSTADIAIMLQNYSNLVPGATYTASIEMDGWTGLAGISAIFAKAIDTGDFSILGADHDYSGIVGSAPATVTDGMYEFTYKAKTANARLSLAARGLAGAVLGGTIDALEIVNRRIA